MKLNEFKIGAEFYCDGRKWRCTDVGTRTVIALPADRVMVATSESGETSCEERPVTERDFSGPPYANAEHVFDEPDIEACTLAPPEA
jgi:hypothetical protein